MRHLLFEKALGKWPHAGPKAKKQYPTVVECTAYIFGMLPKKSKPHRGLLLFGCDQGIHA